MTAPKNRPNIALKIAIVASELKQREVAMRTRIPEVRLSKIVRGNAAATDAERAALARILKKDIAELFSTQVPA